MDVSYTIPMTDVKSSGAELPAAINVAPATSSLSWRRWQRTEEETNIKFIFPQEIAAAVRKSRLVQDTNSSRSVKA